MGRRYSAGTSYGKPFKKKSTGGKFRKGTWIKYKYVNNRRVATVKSYRKGRKK